MPVQTSEYLDINPGPFTKLEELQALKFLKRGKAVGGDYILGGFFKGISKVATDILTHLFHKIL